MAIVGLGETEMNKPRLQQISYSMVVRMLITQAIMLHFRHFDQSIPKQTHQHFLSLYPRPVDGLMLRVGWAISRCFLTQSLKLKYLTALLLWLALVADLGSISEHASESHSYFPTSGIPLFFNNRAPKSSNFFIIELIYKAKKFKVPPFTI